MSQLSYQDFIDGDQPLAAGFNSRFLLAINLLNSGIEADNIASNAVTTAKIINDAVTLAKMEDGTQGDAFYYGASGAPSRLTAGTASFVFTTKGAAANPVFGPVYSASVALTDAATITVDATLGNYFRVTLGGNRTLSNPTGALNGQKLMFELIQDGTGSRTLALDTKFALGVDIATTTLTTTAAARDFIGCIYNSTADKFYVIAFVKGY